MMEKDGRGKKVQGVDGKWKRKAQEGKGTPREGTMCHSNYVVTL